MQGKCIIFSAPSGAGKTTVVKQLLQKPELKLEFSISACNRKPREGEIDRSDYYFITTEDFKKRIDRNEFVEWEEVYNGSYYGTLRSELERIWKKGNNVAFDVDVKGGISLKKLFKKDALSIYIMPPSVETLELRLRDRGTEPEEKIRQRMLRVQYELSLAPQFDEIVVNDVLESTVEKAYHIVVDFLK
jgi:guanylate kinase